jgi:predicted metal-dependent phosphoesterase TrpH
MRLDLHVHTTFSDGDMTPQQVADLAKSLGLDGVAITDHDEFRGFSELVPVPGLMLIPGIEIAAMEGDCEVHVLGLDIDCRNKAIHRYVHSAVEKRRQRAQTIAEKLRAAGYDVTLEDIEQECRGCALGRPHVALALIKKGYAQTLDDAFERFVSRGTPFYVPLERVSVAQAAELIFEAGGKPVLAHPGLLKGGVWDALAPRLKDAGFWGVEVYHPSHSDGQCRIFESEARRLELFATSGSDFHGALGSRAALGAERRGGAYLRKSIKALVSDIRSRA